MVLILGIDSGATKTTSVIANEDGEILGTGEAGPSNYQVVGIAYTSENIKLSIEKAIEFSGLSNIKFDIGCFGIGGLDTKEDYNIISKIIKSLDFTRRNIIVNDVVIALNALTGGNPGIVVVAGTGAIAYGVDPKGKEARSSGWGWLIGDEGSGFDISRKALARAAKASDGREEKTILVEIFKEHFKVKDLIDIIPKVHKKEIYSGEIALLAPLVTNAAEKGDKVATNIFKETGEELGKAVIAVFKKLNFRNEKIIIGGSGGVFHAYDFFKMPFQKTIKKYIPNTEFKNPVKYPIIGTIILGLKYAKIPITKDLINNLENSMESKLKS
jgi:N-acetylglucosamine kinase-like BadF-type ATPase